METGKFVEILDELNRLKDEGSIDQAEYERQVEQLKKQYAKSNNKYGINYMENKSTNTPAQNNAIIILLFIIALSVFGIWFFSSSKFKDTNQANNDIINETSMQSESIDGLRNEFKQAIDSYESTMDGYIAFMVKYKNSNGRDAQLIQDYNQWLKKYIETLQAFENWKGNILNEQEARYYVEVQRRIAQKFMDASVDMNYGI